MKQKRLFSILPALLLSSVAHAGWYDWHNWYCWRCLDDWHLGFVAGLTGGYLSHNPNTEITMEHPAPLRDTSEVIATLDDQGVLWGVLAGVQATCHQWLLGVEFNFDKEKMQIGEHHYFAFTDQEGFGWAAYSSDKADPVMGFSMRIGYAISCVFMPYMRLGVETNKETIFYHAETSPADNLIDIEATRRQYRYLAGFGFELTPPSSRRFGCRIEYNYHSRSKGVDAHDFAEDSVTFVRANVRPKNYQSGKISFVLNIF